MENLSNISSEEELMKLLEEGKISQAEYEELHTAMIENPNEKSSLETCVPESKDKLGKRAFILMLAGIIYAIVPTTLTGPLVNKFGDVASVGKLVLSNCLCGLTVVSLTILGICYPLRFLNF